MLLDGINLLEGSQITNAVINTGSSFPVGPNHAPDQGELFYLTTLDSTAGLYFYTGSAWDKVSFDANVGAMISAAVSSIVGVGYYATLPTSSDLVPPVDKQIAYKTGTNPGFYVYALSGNSWSFLVGPATTLAGYGITNAYTKTEVDTALAGVTISSLPWSAITTTPTTLSGYGITNGQVHSIDLDAISSATADNTELGFLKKEFVTLPNANKKLSINFDDGLTHQDYWNNGSMVGNSGIVNTTSISGSNSLKIDRSVSYAVGYSTFGTLAWASAFTIEFWFNPFSGPASLNGTDGYVVGLVGDLSAILCVSNTGSLYLSNSNYASAISQTVNMNQWNHIAMVVQSRTLNIYINGILGYSTYWGAAGSTTDFQINSGGYTRSAGFYIDNVLIANVARYTSSFIPNTQIDYYKWSATTPTTLAGYGITDAYTQAQTTAAISAATPTFSTLSGKPTTLSGYGITDALNLGGGTLTGNLTISSGSHITINSAPTSDTDAANKLYVDSLAAGLSWKNSVKAATTTNITLTGTQTVDGIALAAGNRILVKDQTASAQNGIYVVAAGAWTRATDMDSTTPINEVNSAAVFVEQGTSFADTGWTQVNNVTALGTDAIAFTQFNGAAGVTAGVGLSKTGNQLDINLGAGISQLPTDEVGIDVYSGGGLFTTVDGTATSTATGAQLSLTKVGTASTYTSVTTDAYGRVTAGSNPTTLVGYGITDAQPLATNLTSIAALTGTSGLLKTNGSGAWSLDTVTYLTGNQSITLSGDITGSGTTAITSTLSDTGVTAGTYTSVTVDAKGRISGGTNPTTLAGYGITDIITIPYYNALPLSSNPVPVPQAVNEIVYYTNGNAEGWNGWGFYTNVGLDTWEITKIDWTALVNKPTTIAGYGITDAVSFNTPVTPGTGTKITYDANGFVTSSTTLAATDIPSLDWTKITTGKPTTLSGYGITDAQPLDTDLSTIAGLAQGANNFLMSNGTAWTTVSGASARTALGAGTGNGTVSSVSVVSANGFAGTVATATSTPAITISTSITGLLKGNGTSISAAISGTDYVLPSATTFIGTTSVALNRASANLSLTGISSIVLPGATSGNITLTPAAIAAATAITIPATSGTLVTTGDTGSVTNNMLAGSIAITKLASSAVTVGTTAISLGAASTTLAGLTSVTSTGFTGALTGNASTATSIAAGIANQIPYQTGVGATSFYSASNYGVHVYGATGVPQSIAGAAGVLVGSASAIPSWSTAPTLTGTNFTGIPILALTSSSITLNGTSVLLGASVNLYAGTTALSTTSGAVTLPNSALTNSSVTVGSTVIALGATSTTLAGLTSVTSTGFTGALTGNASTATTLQTSRNINGVAFNGSADITIADSTKLPTAGGTLTGALTLAADPVSALQAATKQYVDNTAAGLSWKSSVKAATTANIASLSTGAPSTLDGVTLAAGNRVLVKDQTTQSQNGIYTVATLGTGANGVWTRATDMDSTTPINEVNAAAVFVEQGTTLANTGWTEINNVVTLGTDAIAFSQFTGAAALTAGTGITKSGNTLSLTSGIATIGTYKSVTVDTYGRVTAGTNPNTLAGYGITDASPLVGSSSIVTTGTITSGTWNAGIISSTYGGTGINNAGRTLTINTNSGTIAFSTASTTLTVANTASISGTNTGDQTITLTGDVTGTGTGSFATTLATVTQSTGANFVKITLDTKGRVTGNTAVSNADINAAHGSQTANTILAAPNGAAGNPTFRALVAADLPSLSSIYQPLDADLTAIAALTGSSGFLKSNGAGTWTIDTATYLTANQTITLSGDITGSGTTAITGTLATVTQGAGANFVKITLDTKGRVTGNTAVATSDLTALLSSTYQPLDADLTAIAALTGSSGFLKSNGAGTWTVDTSTYLTTATAASTYQPLDGDLTSIAALAGTTGILTKTALNTWALDTTTYLTSAYAGSSSIATVGTITSGTWNAGAVTSSGAVTGTQLVSTVAIGTAPLTVTSTTVVPNLNADMLDGLQASAFAQYGAIGGLVTGTFTASGTAQQAAMSLSATVYRTVEFTVQATLGTTYNSSKFMVIHDGTNTSVTEYGNVALPLGSSLSSLITADISGGNIRLLVTPVTTATVYKIIAQAVAV